MLGIRVADIVAVVIGGVAPIGSRIGGVAVTLAAQDALLTARAGRLSGGAGAGGERGTVTTHKQTAEIAEQAARGGRENSRLNKGVFQPLLQIVGPGLRRRVERLLCEVAGDGIALSE